MYKSQDGKHLVGAGEDRSMLLWRLKDARLVRRVVGPGAISDMAFASDVLVAATVGEDEHSVGLREILDIKHGGIEKYGVKYHYLGTSVPISKLVDAAIETGANAILISTIISHNDIHREQMRRLDEICKEKGIRDKMILIAGGTQVTRDMAAETGLDATFGRGTKGIQVVDAIVKTLKAKGALD